MSMSIVDQAVLNGWVQTYPEPFRAAALETVQQFLSSHDAKDALVRDYMAFAQKSAESTSAPLPSTDRPLYVTMVRCMDGIHVKMLGSVLRTLLADEHSIVRVCLIRDINAGKKMTVKAVTPPSGWNAVAEHELVSNLTQCGVVVTLSYVEPEAGVSVPSPESDYIARCGNVEVVLQSPPNSTARNIELCKLHDELNTYGRIGGAPVGSHFL